MKYLDNSTITVDAFLQKKLEKLVKDKFKYYTIYCLGDDSWLHIV